MRRRISVVLVDDHPLVLMGLRDFLSAQRDIKIVGVESDPANVRALVARVKPDVLIVDLMMPGLSGLDVVRQVRQAWPGTHCVVLSMHEDPAYVSEALRAGAKGYVLKCVPPEELLRAIRAVVSGARYLSPPLSEEQIGRHTQRLLQPAIEPHELLTRREREVLGLVAGGNTSAEIASRLGISVRTVESHRANLLGKLDLRNQADLVRYALQHGIAPIQ